MTTECREVQWRAILPWIIPYTGEMDHRLPKGIGWSDLCEETKSVWAIIPTQSSLWSSRYRGEASFAKLSRVAVVCFISFGWGLFSFWQFDFQSCGTSKRGSVREQRIPDVCERALRSGVIELLSPFSACGTGDTFREDEQEGPVATACMCISL